MMRFIGLVIFSLLAQSSSQAARPLALVYEGPGSCPIAEGDCSGAAQVAVEAAGYQVRRVGPTALTATSTEADYQKIFADAAVWVQPGGGSKTFLTQLSPEMKTAIRRFVESGKGYVGFCAGAFSATELDGGLTIAGLGIFPGKTYPYPNELMDVFFDHVVSYFNPDAYYNQILEVSWNGKLRHLYFEEGPSMDLSGLAPGQVEVIAHYRNGQVAAARTTFGKGRVYLTGAHPEAPQSWRRNPNLADPDGVDLDLVKEMLDWATRRSNSVDQPATPTSSISPRHRSSQPRLSQSDHTGETAKYATFVQSSLDAPETPAGTSELKLIAKEDLDHYTLQITNTTAAGLVKVSASRLDSQEIERALQNDFYLHCTENYGVTTTVEVGKVSRPACKIETSNTTFYIGAGIFEVLKTVSRRANGSTVTTVLSESHTPL